MIVAALILALALLALLLFLGRLASRLTERISDRYLPLDIPAALACMATAAIYFLLLWKMHQLSKGLFSLTPFFQAYPWLSSIALLLALGVLMEPLLRFLLVKKNQRAAKKILEIKAPEKLKNGVIVRRYCVKSQSAFTLVQLSDLHYNARVHSFLATLVEEINARNVDYLAFTGDFIQKTEDIKKLAALLAKLKVKRKVFFVCGNHDFWTGADKGLVEEFSKLGFVHLENEIYSDENLTIAGSEEPWGKTNKPFPKPKTDDKLLLALSHDPDEWPRWRAQNVPIVLSGHTHGGQIRLGPFGPLIFPSQNGSLFCERELSKENSVLLISRGLGKPYFRFCNPAEITLITFVTEK